MSLSGFPDQESRGGNLSSQSWLESYRWPIILVLVAIILGAVLVFISRNPQPQPLVIATPSGISPAAPSLKVYVSGAIKNPGVYSLKEGDRVADALEAAGGALPEADLAAINLARRVGDEMQIYVPKAGEALPGGEAGKLDINRVSQAELEALPGIGPVTAQKILDYRKQKSGFRSTDELLTAKLVSRTTFEAIKDKITVR